MLPYRFEDSFDETKYGKEICRVKGLNFRIHNSKGYLWNVIDRLSEINKCYAGLYSSQTNGCCWKDKGALGIFSISVTGDKTVWWYGSETDLSNDEQVEILFKKIVKRSGTELVETLWKDWGLKMEISWFILNKEFQNYLGIKIDDVNSRIRAFKFMYWATMDKFKYGNIFPTFIRYILLLWRRNVPVYMHYPWKTSVKEWILNRIH